MLFDALQHLALYNFNNSIAPLLLKKKQKCRIILYLREGVSTSKPWYISNVIMTCPVQFSYGQPCSGTRFCCHCKFTLAAAPFGIITRMHIYNSLSFSNSCISPFCLLQEALGFLLIPYSRCSSLFVPVISPILWEFWLRRNYTSASQCFSGSSAKWNTVGLVRDAPALVSMVTAGLYLVQLFHCAWLSVFNQARREEWGPFPRGLSRKWDNISHHRQTKSFSSRRDHVMNFLPFFRKWWCREKVLTIKHITVPVKVVTDIT